MLVGDKVILNEDHDIDSFLIALDQKTGEVAWKTAREEATRSYATPVVFDNHGRTEILVAGSRQLAAYDPSDGKKLWWFDGLSRIVDSTPVVANGEIYLATWTPGGDSDNRIRMEPFPMALTSFDKNGDGEIGKDELPAGDPILERFFRIDLSQNQGLDQQEWEKHALVFERAQNIAAAIRPGTHGLLPAENVNWNYQRSLPTVPSSVVYGGVVTILKAGRDWSILGSHDFKERILATPVISDGLMLIRTDNALYAFRAK